MKVGSMTEFPSNISDNIRTVAPQGEPCDTALPTNAGRIDLHAVRRDITRANDPAVQGEGRRVVESRVRYAAAALVDEVSQLRVALDETMRERDYARLDVADHDAGVRAEERQRLLGELGKAAAHPFKGPNDTDASMLLEAAKRIEGGYVAGGSHTRETTGRVLRMVADMLTAGSAVPVATPTEPVDEVKCPNCQETIRARMSDQPEVAPAEPTIAEQAGYYVVTFPGGDTSTWETNRSYLFNPTAVWQLRNNADALEAITRHRSRTAPAEQDGQR